MIVVSLQGIFEITAAPDEHGRPIRDMFLIHARDAAASELLLSFDPDAVEPAELFRHIIERLHYVDSIAAEASRIHGPGSVESSRFHRISTAVSPLILVSKPHPLPPPHQPELTGRGRWPT